MCILSNVYPGLVLIPDLRRRGSLGVRGALWYVRGVRVDVREIGIGNTRGCQGERTSVARRFTIYFDTIHPYLLRLPSVVLW